MAKKKYYASKGPDPINAMIDLAGAFAMGAVAKHKIKKDYQKGEGEESALAATMVLGLGSLRSGGDGLMALGGLYGVNSAIRDIERSEKAKLRRKLESDDDTNFPSYKTNNNRYAWRLNCEDGSAWGVSPYAYETRDAYNEALQHAKGGETKSPQKKVVSEEPVKESPFKESPFLCCRVSRLDNGANEYYLTDDDSIKIGDTITVSTDDGTSEGIVIGVKKLSEMTEEEFPKENTWILTKEDNDG